MQTWINNILSGDKRVAIPIMTHPGIEFIGKSVKDAVTDGNVHFAAIKALYENYPLSDAATTIMDLTVESEAFGADISFPEDEVPSVTNRLVATMEDVQKLAIPDISAGRVPQYLLASKLAAEYISDKPVLSGCIGPYSLAGRLFDMTEIMMALYTEPDTVKLLLEKCTEFLMAYCKAIKATGVQGVVMAEPAAGLLSNEDCQQYSSVYVKQIVDAVQDDNFAVILHNCGNGGHCTSAMVYTGSAGYHFGNKMDMVQALRECPSNSLVMGNLDPVAVFKQSTSEEVKQKTHELLEHTRTHKNFVISSGCDTPPHTPLKNIEAFYEAVKEYNEQ